MLPLIADIAISALDVLAMEDLLSSWEAIEDSLPSWELLKGARH